MSSVEAKFSESNDLKQLVREIIALDLEEFNDVKLFKLTIFYTEHELPHLKAAHCQRLSDVVRFKTGFDYFVLVCKERFLQATTDEKLRVVCHELRHVENQGKKEPVPGLREHEEDFCEIASHDAYSRGIAERIKDQLPALKKIPVQADLGTFGGETALKP